MVLVMDNGLASEWGRPATLLDDPNGTFTSKHSTFLRFQPSKTLSEPSTILDLALPSNSSQS